MKPTTLLLLIAATICRALAAPLAPDDAKALETRATKIGMAFDAWDADAIIEMTHPSLSALVGGKDKLLEVTRNAMAELKAKEVKVIESKLGEPTEVYPAADELVCFYPRTTVIAIGEKKANSTGFFVCIRKARGGEWLFLDGSGLRKQPGLLKTLLPALTDNVKLPENKVELVQ